MLKMVDCMEQYQPRGLNKFNLINFYKVNNLNFHFVKHQELKGYSIFCYSIRDNQYIQSITK